MRLKVDHKNEALYFRLDESAIVASEEVKPGLIGGRAASTVSCSPNTKVRIRPLLFVS